VSVEQTLALLLVLVTLVLAVATLAVAIVTVRGFKDQLQLQTFSEYTRRYNELIDALPFGAGGPTPSIEIGRLEPSERERVMKTMRRYFNLCWEELHLYKSGKIDSKTWEIWVAGIRDTLRSPFFQQAWRELKPEYTYGGHAEEFLQMIDRCIAAHISNAQTTRETHLPAHNKTMQASVDLNAEQAEPPAPGT
jgi:hypothetical protein